MPTKKSSRTWHAIGTLGIGLAERGDVRINRLQDRLAPKIPFPHKHDFYQLIFVKTGKGWHDVDFTRHNVHSSQVFILKPGQVHGWELAKSSKGFVVEFTNESLRSYFSVDIFPDVAKWDLKNLPESLFVEMEAEFMHPDKLSQQVLQGYLEVLLLKLSRDLEEPTAKSTVKEDLHREFRDLVEVHFKTEHAVEFYAELLKISAKSLSAKIQRLVGQSAKDIIQERLLLEAKRLLVYSHLSISEIGYDLGFEDANYFSRFLKQNMEESAMKFRERSQK
jgi:AraC-type DNA-binding domain-containing proteins